jgi:hypothetical protein
MPAFGVVLVMAQLVFQQVDSITLQARSIFYPNEFWILVDRGSDPETFRVSSSSERMLDCYQGPKIGELRDVVEACMEAEAKLEGEYYSSVRNSYFENEYRSARE